MTFCDLTQFYSPVSGGVRRYIEQKAAYIRRARLGDRHILVVPGEKDTVSGDETCRTYTIASPLVSRTARYRALLRLGQVEKILMADRPDLIESGDPYQLAWKAIRIGAKLNIPVLGFYHSHFPEAILRTLDKYLPAPAYRLAHAGARRYVRSLYSRFAATFVANPALETLLRTWGIAHIETVDLGVDTAIFTPGEPPTLAAAETTPPPQKTCSLLYVGRLAIEKNVSTLIEAFRLLDPAKFHLTIAGDGSLRPQVQRLAADTGRVTWIPYCSDPYELANLYRSADIFVHPGIQETFGLVAIESQACGTPVVGIRGSYMDRIILTNQMHWASENTPQALAQAIATIANSDLRSDGLAASQAVRSRFSWDCAFDRIFKTYDRL